MDIWRQYLYVDDTCWTEEKRYCYRVPALPPVVQEEFEDMRICGEQGGLPFTKAVRPNKLGVCPKNHSPCSKATSVQNTICYSNTEGQGKCPINDIVFAKQGSTQFTQLNSNLSYVKVQFDSDYSIFYTKDANQLPITSTKVEYKPCAKDSERSRSPGQVFYLLEKEEKDCTVDKLNGKTFDTRYVESGYRTNLYEIQDDSDVWDDLKIMPQFNRDTERQNRISS